MLPSPVLMYKMDELNSINSGVNTVNGGSSMQYNESVILNYVRNRKKVSELPNCPLCSCTIRQGELESHLALEVERLQKLSAGASKRKLSVTSQSPSPQNLAVPGTSADVDEEIDFSGFAGSEVFQRVHENRIRRLRARRRTTPPPMPYHGECPVCNSKVPVSRIQRHALRCLKRTGAQLDEPVPDTSSDDESIDVENDEPASSGFGAEYQWCGEWRVRASALQGTVPSATCVRRASNDLALVVDGDEDTELYGPPQYSPSRVALENEEPTTEPDEETPENEENIEREKPDVPKKELTSNGLVEASAETRIQALKAKIKELESKNNSSAEAKCLICLGSYTSPAVSIQCWHVYCEVCWLQSLRAKKICPQCNTITTVQHLRRIYI